MALGEAGCRQFRVDLVGGPWRLQRGLALGDLPATVADELDPAADRCVVGGPGTDLLLVSGGREAPPGAATDGLADAEAEPAVAAQSPGAQASYSCVQPTRRDRSPTCGWSVAAGCYVDPGPGRPVWDHDHPVYWCSLVTF